MSQMDKLADFAMHNMHLLFQIWYYAVKNLITPESLRNSSLHHGLGIILDSQNHTKLIIDSWFSLNLLTTGSKYCIYDNFFSSHHRNLRQSHSSLNYPDQITTSCSCLCSQFSALQSAPYLVFPVCGCYPTPQICSGKHM